MADGMLTVAEAAVRLGTWKTSGERFPRRLVAERRIRFVKVGTHVRIPESAVEEFIASNTVEPVRRRRARYGRAA
ncbi:excisionase family DNA-binding protein [Streptomyces sp. NBC_00648]|uniref:excisionase family DNA-binding protein n=1 Tax=Streptomyces sp. NBC_00648 TaxID=2975797 RepID=UPI003244A274